MPNSLVVTRGCPQHCDFCYKDAFFFRQTVDWAIDHGLTTATFHIQTPCPGTALHARMESEHGMTPRDWERYDTRHVV